MLLLHSSPGTNKYTCLNFAKCKVITCEVSNLYKELVKFYIDGNIVVTAPENAAIESAKTNNFCTLLEIINLEQSFKICSDKMTLLPAVIFHYLEDESKEDFLEYYRKYCLTIKETEVKEAIDRLPG